MFDISQCQVVLKVKSPFASADLRHSGSIPGLEGGNQLQYSCWRIPWTEKLGKLQSKTSQRVRHN